MSPGKSGDPVNWGPVNQGMTVAIKPDRVVSFHDTRPFQGEN